jgi:hypothetical protein
MLLARHIWITLMLATGLIPTVSSSKAEPGFDCSDKVVSIIAVELNTKVLE